jgi:hypothetical protein
MRISLTGLMRDYCILWVIAERMRDDAPAHFSCAVRDVLNNTCHGRCIGSGGPNAWPPRSPDLNPQDVYLCGYLKPSCMQLLLTTKRHIAFWMPVRLSATTPPSVNGCGGPWWDVSRRALNLLKDILSTYYKCTLSTITHKLNISGHILIRTFFFFFWYVEFVPKFYPYILVTRVQRTCAQFGPRPLSTTVHITRVNQQVSFNIAEGTEHCSCPGKLLYSKLI